MKKSNKSKPLSVSEKMRDAEKLGAKVAKIINKAQAQVNKALAESGHQINVETSEAGVFWKIIKKEEVNPNG